MEYRINPCGHADALSAVCECGRPRAELDLQCETCFIAGKRRLYQAREEVPRIQVQIVYLCPICTYPVPDGETEACPHCESVLAPALAPLGFLTPLEAACETGTSESGWRNRAAGGQIPGAIKKGKQWLIPQSSIDLK